MQEHFLLKKRIGQSIDENKYEAIIVAGPSLKKTYQNVRNLGFVDKFT